MTNSAPPEPSSFRIGIDLGGTKIAGALLGPAGDIRAEMRVAAPKGSPQATVEAVAGLVAALEQAAGIHSGAATVGVGMPGSPSPSTGLIRNANSVWLNGTTFEADLATALGRAVRVANDANCFALSEATDGAGADAKTVFGVIVGTGCGGGVVVDGKLLVGRHGIAGEWGHCPLPWAGTGEHPGERCWCGRYGCMETWVSGTALAADHARVTGNVLSGEAVAIAAAAGDIGARASLDRHASRLARGLAMISNILDPDVIVLGGGLSKLGHLYSDLPRLMAPYMLTSEAVPQIRPPRWGDAGGVRGAAWLWNDRFQTTKL